MRFRDLLNFIRERLKTTSAPEKAYLGMGAMFAGGVIGFVAALQALGQAGASPAPSNEMWTQSLVKARDIYSVYALGHFRFDGLLPPPRSSLYFSRLKDDEGNSLHGDCVYELSGPAPSARWWSINAVEPGRFYNATSFTAGNAILTGDDMLRLTLSRKPMPGNWLAPPDVDAMQITLVMNEPYDPLTRATKLVLPKLIKLDCQ